MCTRFGLAIGYYCSPIIFVLLVVLCPIAFPIALLLDRVLGKEHGMYFRRAGQLNNVNILRPSLCISMFQHTISRRLKISLCKVKCLIMCFCFSELRELVKMHGTHEKSNEEPLSYDEVLIVKVRIVKKSVDWSSQVSLYRVHWR